MDSRIREIYSKSAWFYLSLFLFFISSIPASGQELIWAHHSDHTEPQLTIVREGSEPILVVVGSPFHSTAFALNPTDGRQVWQSELGGSLARPGALVADVVILATHTGRLLALDTGTGEILWQYRTERASDYAAASPMFVDSSLYTLSRRGNLSRFDLGGQRQRQVETEALYEGRRPDLVPLWRDARALSFLDQAGRLRTYELETLRTLEELVIPTAPGPGLGSQRSEILAGVYSSSRQIVWTTELSGRLRATSTEDATSLWAGHLGPLEDLWSKEGRLLAVPILSAGENQRVLILTRQNASVFDSTSGEQIQRTPLPAPAIAPPLFDRVRRTWWLVTESSLIELDWEGRTRETALPFLDVPYSASLAGDLLVLASRKGRIFGLSLRNAPSFDQPDPSVPVLDEQSESST